MQKITIDQGRSVTFQTRNAIMMTSSDLMMSLVIRQQNKKVTYTDKYLVLLLGLLSPVHISLYIYCPSTSLSCATTANDRSCSLPVPVASGSLG